MLRTDRDRKKKQREFQIPAVFAIVGAVGGNVRVLVGQHNHKLARVGAQAEATAAANVFVVESVVRRLAKSHANRFKVGLLKQKQKRNQRERKKERKKERKQKLLHKF